MLHHPLRGVTNHNFVMFLAEDTSGQTDYGIVEGRSVFLGFAYRVQLETAWLTA
jgi:hypothetical protein